MKGSLKFTVLDLRVTYTLNFVILLEPWALIHLPFYGITAT